MMKRLLALLLLMTAPAISQVQQIQIQFLDEFMREVDLTTSASIYIYNIGTTTESNIYLDRNRQVAITQPITDTSTNTPLDYTRGILTFYKRQPGFKIVVTDGSYSRTIDSVIQQSNVIWWPTFMTGISQVSGIADLAPAGGNDMLLHDGSDWVLTNLSPLMVTLLDDLTATAARATLGVTFPAGVLQTVIDPGASYASDHEAFLMEVDSTRFPNGIIINSWSISFNVDPDRQLDADLKYADAWIGLANAVKIDELDTNAGISSETTGAEINSGLAIAAGKVIYMEFHGDPDGTGTQMILTINFTSVDD